VRDKAVEDLVRGQASAVPVECQRFAARAIPARPAAGSARSAGANASQSRKAQPVRGTPYPANGLMAQKNRCAARIPAKTRGEKNPEKLRRRTGAKTRVKPPSPPAAARILGIDCGFVTARLGNCDGGAFPNPADLSDTSGRAN